MIHNVQQDSNHLLIFLLLILIFGNLVSQKFIKPISIIMTW